MTQFGQALDRPGLALTEVYSPCVIGWHERCPVSLPCLPPDGPCCCACHWAHRDPPA